jgi:hypothetical protein
VGRLEIRNDAHDRWRQAVADTLRTDPERVLVSCLHQHDAPVADLEAERLLRQHKATGSIYSTSLPGRPQWGRSAPGPPGEPERPT